MKKFLASVLIFIFCSLFAAAQNLDTKIADWKIFSPPNEQFSVEIPVDFFSRDYADEDSSRRYYNKFDQTYFFIFADKGKKSPQYNYVRDFVNPLRFRSGANFIKQTVSFGGVPGEKIYFAERDDFYHTILLVKTANRAYVFHAVSPAQNDADAARFFASLKINENAAPEPPPSETAQPLEEDLFVSAKTVQENMKPFKKQSRETKNETKQNALTNQYPQDAPPTPLKIVSTERADYTDFARFYYFEGTVALRVTFLPGGTIGSISAAQKLPFGLTARAIEAARNIRFEPMIKKGMPVAVTKTIEYVFKVY